MSRWYRAYEGTVTDPKLGEVALVAGCSRSVAIATWHAILEDCAAVNDGGRFETTPRRVAVILGEPIATMEAVFAELATLGMIADGAASAWTRRQFESDSSTERVRKHREAKRNAASADANAGETMRNGDATLLQRCATPPYTETDTDTEGCVGLRAPARETPDATADLRQSIVSAFSEVQSATIPDTSRAGVWIAKGYQPAICLATIREGLARKPDIRSLAYFDRAIADAHAAPVARAPPSHAPPRRLTILDGLALHDARTSQS